MEWLRAVCDWFLSYWKTISLVGFVGLVAKMIHWWWSVRKEKALALKAEAELRLLKEEEEIKAILRRIEALIRAGQEIHGRGWFPTEIKASPGENPELVAEAWRRFLKND